MLIYLYILINKLIKMPESVFSLKIFEWIAKDVIENIVLNCKEKNFSDWEIIMAEWEDSNWEWYIIKSWSVNIWIGGKHVAELHAGDIVWEIALLNEEPRTATVNATSDVELIILTINDLIEMINNDENKINKEIMRRIEENLKNT